MAKYVRRGHKLNVAYEISQPEAKTDTTNKVTVNNIVTRDIHLDDLDEADIGEQESYSVTPPLVTSNELWTVSLLKMIIAAINNAYFNAKLVDNIILLDDLKGILEAVIHKRVEITLAEVEPKCSKCEKLVLIRDIAKITVYDADNTQQNFKYAYNTIYESLLNDFHINMNRVYVNPII